MFGSVVLDVAIGLAFIYLLLAVICTAVSEWLASLFKWRAKTLEQGIHRMFNSTPGLAKEFYEHPLIKAQAAKEGGRPSYISPRAFALALMDVIGEKGENPKDASLEHRFASGVGRLPETLRKSLDAVVKSSAPGTSQEKVETWFNDQMDRVSGWYKRKMQGWSLVLAATVVLLANADTLQIADRLWQNPVLRTNIVEQAKARAQMAPPPEYTDAESPAPTPPKPQATNANPLLTQEEKNALAEVAGWRQESKRFREESLGEWLPPHLLGWGLSTVAVSLGAPFWFDLLNQFMKVRAAGQKPGEKKQKEQPA